MNSVELRHDKAKLVAELRKLADKHDITAEDDEAFDKINQDINSLDKRIDQLEAVERAEAGLKETAGRKVSPVAPAANSTTALESRDFRNSPEYRNAFRSYLVSGFHLNSAELRALEATNDVAGGYMVMPQQMANDLIKFVDDAVVIRQRATKYSVPEAKSLGIVSLDTDPADSDWTAELLTGDFDSSMAFGKRELQPHPLAKKIKVSNKLLRASPNVESLVVSRLAYKVAVSEEKAFLSGNGVNQPLGLFTASANGISTGRDSLTGSATNLTADGLIGAFYTLKAQYQANAVWIVSRKFVELARKLKGSDNNYLWQPGLSANNPDTLLGRPVIVSEFAPNTFTTGKYVGILGDLSRYVIADAMNIQVQRLVELYAETNQVGFIVRQEVDGMPSLEEAFVRLKTD